MKFAFLLVAAVAALAAGCSSSKVVHERGWIGGQYKLARSPRMFQSSSVVPAFPGELQHSAGVFVAAAPTNSPVALAGLRAGDLIVEIDSKPVERLDRFWKRIDAAQPGTALLAKCYRDGDVFEREIIAGRETFRSVHTLGLGFMLSRHWDLWPNPEFSLIALGYEPGNERLELFSPESTFVRETQRRNDKSANAEAGMISREGWKSWLVIVSLGAHKRILSQEVSNRRVASRELARQ